MLCNRLSGLGWFLTGYCTQSRVRKNFCSHQRSALIIHLTRVGFFLGTQSHFTEEVRRVKSCNREAGERGSRLCRLCTASISVWKNDGDELCSLEVKELGTVSLGLRRLSLVEENLLGLLLKPDWMTVVGEGARSVEGIFILSLGKFVRIQTAFFLESHSS